MASLSIVGMLNKRDESRYGLIVGVVAALLAVTVFYIDTFTTIEGAIAVLYVIVLLLSSESLSRRGLVMVASLCTVMALYSYLVAHGFTQDIQTFLRLTVSIAALLITTILLLRNQAFRDEILSKNAALRDSEMRYRSIFDQTRVALWERDYSQARRYLLDLKASGVRNLRAYCAEHPEVVERCIDLIRTVASNDAARELLGEGASDTTKGSMRRFVAPGDHTFFELLEAIFDQRDHFEGKGTVRTEDGENRSVLISISFPEDPKAFDRVVVGMIDVTQRDLTQKALLEAQAELTRASRAATVGAMSASLSHELNQPLGAIVLNAQTLLRWLDRDPPDLNAVRRSAERIIRDSERASQIIRNTRSMLSQKESETELVDLPTLVEETRALMEHDLDKDAVSVETKLDPTIPPVKAVRIELQQVLINLMTNAIQAMSSAESPQRKLTITLGRSAKAHVSLSVHDTGPGISEEGALKLFTPFYTTKSSGMGMGLSICRSTLDARGGKLDGYNSPQGGAIFEMTLPVGHEND